MIALNKDFGMIDWQGSSGTTFSDGVTYRDDDNVTHVLATLWDGGDVYVTTGIGRAYVVPIRQIQVRVGDCIVCRVQIRGEWRAFLRRVRALWNGMLVTTEPYVGAKDRLDVEPQRVDGLVVRVDA